MVMLHFLRMSLFAGICATYFGAAMAGTAKVDPTPNSAETPHRQLRLNTSVPGDTPQYWDLTLTHGQARVLVTAREAATGRQQRFAFHHDRVDVAGLSRSRLHKPSTAAAKVTLGREESHLVFDRESRRFVAMTSSSQPKHALRLVEPARESSKGGRWLVVQREGGNASGSITCWRPNGKGTVLTELISADVITDDHGHRLELPDRHAKRTTKKPRVRYVSTSWPYVGCDKLLQVSGR